MLRFFEEILEYKRGVHYHVCTLQAFLAADLGGETMHHLAGINPLIRGYDEDRAAAAQESTQTRFLLARWLIIDELFMNSAILLACEQPFQ